VSDVLETLPAEVESSELVPVCASCGAEIMRVRTDQVLDSSGQVLRYQIVAGTFIVALDEQGHETGPRWGFCLPCVEAGVTVLPTKYLEEGAKACRS
jgi:hypothetical protein